MKLQYQALFELFNPQVSGLGFELVGVEMQQNGHHSTLRIFIDKDEGINIDDCVLVSRQLSSLLDVEDPIKGEYELEVSSPGLDRRLFTLEQIKRYIGHTIKIKLYDKIENRKRFSGEVISVDEDKLVINCDNEDISIPADMIESARLVPEI